MGREAMKASDGSLLGDPGRTPLSKKESVKWQRPRLTRQALMRCCLVKWILSSAAPQGSEPSLGAAYVSDAQYNRNVPFQTSPQAIRLYYFYNHWAMRMATDFFICVDLSLALFEEPVLFLLPFLKLDLNDTI
ncbi:uncharacterized protein ACH125_000038 [Urocitellus parryii]